MNRREGPRFSASKLTAWSVGSTLMVYDDEKRGEVDDAGSVEVGGEKRDETAKPTV